MCLHHLYISAAIIRQLYHTYVYLICFRISRFIMPEDWRQKYAQKVLAAVEKEDFELTKRISSAKRCMEEFVVQWQSKMKDIRERDNALGDWFEKTFVHEVLRHECEICQSDTSSSSASSEADSKEEPAPDDAISAINQVPEAESGSQDKVVAPASPKPSVILWVGDVRGAEVNEGEIETEKKRVKKIVETEHESPAKKSKVVLTRTGTMLLGDSNTNGVRINSNYLHHQCVRMSSAGNTIDDVEISYQHLEESSELREMLVIHTGTNEIREYRTVDDVIRRLKTLEARHLKNTAGSGFVYIIQLPEISGFEQTCREFNETVREANLNLLNLRYIAMTSDNIHVSGKSMFAICRKLASLGAPVLKKGVSLREYVESRRYVKKR